MNKINRCCYLIVSTIIVFVVCLSACNDDNLKVEPFGAFIGGIVTDSVTQSPIYSAWVSNDSVFDSTDALTDSEGNYVLFTGTPDIYCDAFCGKEGYVISKKRFSTISAETTTVDFKLISR